MDYCRNLKAVLKDHPNLIQKHKIYGHIVTWMELSKEKTYHKTHNYGISIKYCPFCGTKLT